MRISRHTLVKKSLVSKFKAIRERKTTTNRYAAQYVSLVIDLII